jgi:hypothetical protein
LLHCMSLLLASASFSAMRRHVRSRGRSEVAVGIDSNRFDPFGESAITPKIFPSISYPASSKY